MKTEHVDVLIVGAGLSGIGAAYHLQTRCPGRPTRSSKAATRIGGTWDLFRYPGIRSDSDMYTLGYSFRPGRDAEGDRRRPVDPQLHPRDRAQTTASTSRSASAIASSALVVDARRALDGRSRDAATGETVHAHLQLPLHVHRLLRLRRRLHAGVRRARALRRAASCIRSTGPTTSTTPASASSSSAAAPPRSRWFRSWPSSAAHVTMLQRSPTYIISRPASDASPTGCARACPRKLAYALRAGRTCSSSMAFYRSAAGASRRARMKLLMLGHAQAALGADYDVDRTSRRSYNPWDQRLCLVARRRSVRRDPRRQRARSSPTTSRRFTETGFACAPGRSSRPTSSSPPPG